MHPLPEPEPLTPPADPTVPVAPPTLKNDLKEVQHYASLVLLFASIPALGIPGVVANLLHVNVSHSLTSFLDY